MTAADHRLAGIAKTVHNLPRVPTPAERAGARLDRGEGGLADIEVLAREKEDGFREQLQRQLVDNAMPYRRVRSAVTRYRPINSGSATKLRTLISYQPDEEPEPLLVKIIRDAQRPLVGRKDGFTERIFWLVMRWAIGADDGLPLRIAIAEGEYGEGPSMPFPPAGIGTSRCPLSCHWRATLEYCLCTGTADKTARQRAIEFFDLPRCPSVIRMQERLQAWRDAAQNAAISGQTRPRAPDARD